MLRELEKLIETEADEMKGENVSFVQSVQENLQLLSSSRIMTETVVSVWTAFLPHISETVDQKLWGLVCACWYCLMDRLVWNVMSIQFQGKIGGCITHYL